ncbi:MAG: glycosyltransferase [Clostridia bacterium]
MIFVMLGTQKQQFTRLLDILSNSKYLNDKEVIVQNGNTKYNKFKLVNFLDQDVLDNYIKNCEFVITHGGVGSIFLDVKYNKKVLTIPRKKEYKEHVDNHQKDICEKLNELNYILNYTKDIDQDINKLLNKEFKKYDFNNNCTQIIKNDIDNI